MTHRDWLAAKPCKKCPKGLQGRPSGKTDKCYQCPHYGAWIRKMPFTFKKRSECS